MIPGWTMTGRHLAGGLSGLAMCVLVAGCAQTTAVVDPAYSRLSFGYLNSGMAELGRLYLIDTKAKTITEIGTVPVSQTARGEPASYAARQVSDLGVTLNGSVAAANVSKSAVEAAVEAKVGRTAELRLDDYFDMSYSALDADITTALRAQAAKMAAGDGSGWEIDTVLRNPDLIYLLVFRTYAARSAVFALNGVSTAGATADVVDVGNLTVEVKLSGDSTTTWTGSGRPAVVEYVAFRPRLEKGPGGTEHLRFRRYGVRVPEKLSETLRTGMR